MSKLLTDTVDGSDWFTLTPHCYVNELRLVIKEKQALRRMDGLVVIVAVSACNVRWVAWSLSRIV